MSKVIFSAFQIKQVETNPNVSKVSEHSITYHPDFKLKAVKEYLKNKEPMQIFLENGSGYYRWLRTEKTRCDREEADEKDDPLIKGSMMLYKLHLIF
ncbi:hypothetical protein P9597_29910 [Aneurinibacillus migulanus]|uniref:hypothetical protein n=1 Tax=Aneurinibacillus migulanus TaxID=47500 RepID=UPI002E250B1D|nr:hypothetical protein [Aneurinibacillus migulanus]